MKEDDDRHCSECKHYEICTNFYMYCKVLKRRITARKKPCKHYESFIRKQKMKKSLDEIEAGDEVYYTSRYYSKILKVDRVTSTTIVCGSEKFRKQNGRQIPADTWGSSYISVLTESLKNQYYEMIRKKTTYNQDKVSRPFSVIC